ncbi:MAG: hypothetical protein RR806_04145 [Oscillospiraceae bacterium]
MAQDVVTYGAEYVAKKYPFGISCFGWKQAKANLYGGKENKLKK